jgi:hypothetical protein
VVHFNPAHARFFASERTSEAQNDILSEQLPQIYISTALFQNLPPKFTRFSSNETIIATKKDYNYPYWRCHMEEPKTYSLAEAERFFAVEYFNKIWDLLEKQKRSDKENRIMLEYAYASMAHWRVAGTPLNEQRGEWMLSRVHCVLGQTEPALAHAHRCREMTDQHLDLMQDFDLAFSWECIARAHALAGHKVEVQKLCLKAEEMGKLIQDDEDRKIFENDFNGGEWYGLK